MVDFFSVDELTHGFWYPSSFVRVVELGLTDLEPWHVLEGAQLRQRGQGLVQRYPARTLVPFAIRQDNDDVACWDLARGGERIVVIHDFATPGWEGRGEYPDLFGWLRQAIEDLIYFEWSHDPGINRPRPSRPLRDPHRQPVSRVPGPADDADRLLHRR